MPKRIARLSRLVSALMIAGLLLGVASSSALVPVDGRAAGDGGGAPQLLPPQVLAELQEPAFVITDVYGVPHIYARNLHDLYVVTGFVQARDRLFQMDVLRRQASGTLAELLGPDALPSDVQMRTLGIRRAAQASLEAMPPEVRAEAEAFAAGVNAFIRYAQETGQLPPEYALLEIQTVEPWTAVDSLTVGKAIAFDQSLDIDAGPTLAFLSYVNALSQIGLDGAALFFEDLWRSAPAEPVAVIPEAQKPATAAPTARGFPASLNSTSTSEKGGPRLEELRALAERLSSTPTTQRLLRAFWERLKELERLPIPRPLFRHLTAGPGERPGSNWFVISGEHTQSGAPILANDPHLSLTNPAIWYEMHQVIEGELNVAGVTLPGVPYVLLGCTERVCWAPTTNPLDVSDMYRERIVVDEQGRLYSVFRGEREPIQIVPEEFRVNVIGDGQPDTVVPAQDERLPRATLIVPRHGPIVQLDLEAGEALTLKFTGFYPTRELLTFRIWNRARNLEDFKEGLKVFDVGTFNWGYADVDGTIAYFTSGKVPLREDLEQGFVDLIPPFFVRDGTGELQHEWVPEPEPDGDPFPFKTLPLDEMPQIVNPPAGFIVNANNDPVGTTLDNDPLNQLRPTGGLYYLNYSYDPGYRAAQLTARIREALRQGRKLTVEDAQAFLADVTVRAAMRLVPFLLDAIEAARSPQAPPALKAFLKDPRIAKAAQYLRSWSFDTPTGLTEGFDWGKPAGVPPTPEQIRDSVATTIFHVWLARLVANTVDGVLGAISPRLPKPGGHFAVKALIHHLENFEALGGKGASGLPLFAVPDRAKADLPPAVARDLVLLQSLKEALDLLASETFASAFGGSTTLDDYRWGKLHRIVLRHVARFGGPFDLPPDGEGVPVDGGYQVVDRSDPSVRGAKPQDFGFKSGPSRRFVAELSPQGVTILNVLAGGQSGVPGAKHYGDQFPLWLANRLHPIPTDRLAVDALAESWQDFLPLYRR